MTQPTEPLSNQSSPEQVPINIWHYKPWWCQPWSILFTGIGIIAASWLLLHWVWLTVLVAIPVLAWMGFFLGIYPTLMAEEIGETTVNSDIVKSE
jgi:hypothetical protein